MSNYSGRLELHDVEHHLESKIDELTQQIADLNTPIDRVENLRWVLRSLKNTLAYVVMDEPEIKLI
jgi:hypothetical protein